MSKKDETVASPGAAADARADMSTGPANPDFILTIGVVARMFKIPTTTLRLYELLGLIARHQAGRVRVYSWSQCERIALIVKARRAGLRVRDLKPVLVAMDERAPKTASDVGRRHGVSLIHMLEEQQQAIGNVLGELYRIDWELSARLGVQDSGGL
jgi:DNA-binding transcriptional MerR regulator